MLADERGPHLEHAVDRILATRLGDEVFEGGLLGEDPPLGGLDGSVVRMRGGRRLRLVGQKPKANSQ